MTYPDPLALLKIVTSSGQSVEDMNAENAARPGLVWCSNRDDSVVLGLETTAGVLRVRGEGMFFESGSRIDWAISSHKVWRVDAEIEPKEHQQVMCVPYLEVFQR